MVTPFLGTVARLDASGRENLQRQAGVAAPGLDNNLTQEVL